MVQRVEAWGNTLEFPDDMSDEDMASAIRKNEVNLNPNASTFTKAKTAVSSGIDAGLSMLTPKRSIADQAQEQSTNSAGLAASQVRGVPIRQDYYNKTVADTPAAPLTPTVAPKPLVKGNIDLNKRPVVKNSDGSISTVRSMGFFDGKNEVLVPTVSDDGRIMSDAEARQTYFKTGKHLGKFNSVADSNAYAEQLHNDQATQYGGLEQRVRDAAALDTKAQRNKQTVAKALTSAEPVPEEGGFINSAGRTIGQSIKGAGQVGADYLGASPNNPVKQYGQAVIDANPTAVNSLEDIAAKPGTAVAEGTGNAAPSMAGMIGARAVGQGITALSPLAGPAAPLVAAAGQVVSWLGPAAIAALPSYGGIRDKQILNNPTAEQSAKSKAIAAMGAAAVGAIEQRFGPQQWALAAMTKQGRAALAEKFAATTLAGSIGKGAAKGAAIEGAEELAQSPIEQLASGDNPTTKESLKDTAFQATMGVLTGGVLGGGTGMLLGKPINQVPDNVLKYTAERGGKKASEAAQAEIDRREKEGIVNNTPETAPEAVQRIIDTGKDKAREINKDAATASDSIQSSIFDEPDHAGDVNDMINQAQATPDNPTPEPVETLNAQINALADGRKPGVLLTPGEPMPDSLPDGVKTADVPGHGSLLYRDEATLQAARNGQLGTALGYGIDEKPVDATHAVTARDEGGNVIQDVATDGSKSVIQAAKSVAGPSGTVEVRPIEHAMEERDKAVSSRGTKLKDGITDNNRIITPGFYSEGYPWQSGYDEQMSGGSVAIDGKEILKGSELYTVKGQRLRDAIRHAEIAGDEVPSEAYRRLESLKKESGAKDKQVTPPASPKEEAKPTPAAKPAEDPSIRPIVESLIKRKAVASQIGRSRSFDTALADAKDLMAGKKVKPARFKVIADAMNADKPTADILMQLYDKALASHKAALKSAKQEVKGLSVAEVEKHIEPLQKAGTKKVKIAASEADLPKNIQDAIKSAGAAGVRGVYYPQTDEVWLVANKLNNADEAIMVALHEARHRGLRKLFGPGVAPVMRQIYGTNKRVREAANRMMQSTKGMSKEEATEEVLADIAIDKAAHELNGWKKLVQFIQKWLTDHGIKLKFTDAMVESLVAGAETTGMSEDGVVSADSPRFSRAGQNASWDAPEPSKIDNLIYTLQNKHVDLKRVVDAIKTTGTQLADQWNTYLQEELFHGRAAKRTQDFVNRELKPIMMGMKLRGQTVDELDKYLHARHAEEANKLIAKRDPNMPDGGSGMTTQDAKDYLANLPADKRKALENTAKQVDTVIAKTRDTYLSYGLIDQDTADSWENMFKHYVPLMREDNDSGMGVGQGFSIKGKEAKHRTGSKRKVVDILANIALQRERAIVRGEKNRVAVSLAGLAKLNPNPDFWTFDKVPTNRVLVDKKNTYEVHYHGSKVIEFTSPVEAKKFVDFQGDPAYTIKKVEIPAHVEDQADPMYKNRDNVIVAKIKDSKGKIIERAVVFNEHDERAVRMAQSMKNLDATQLEGLLGTSAMITRYFASINTQYNPVFGVVNLIRDLQASMLNLSSTKIAGHKAQVLKNILPAIGAIYASSRAGRKGGQVNSPMSNLWEELQNEGGMTGFRDLFKTSEDRASAIKHELDPTAWMNNGLGKIFTAGGTLKVPLAVAQKKAKWLFDWLSDYNQTLEGAMRLAVYKVAIDKGLSKPQAASIGKNISVNFNRKGQSGQQAGALYAFFNAAMQGTARMGETMTTMDKGDLKTLKFNKAGKTIIAGGISLGVLQALALSTAGFDDDEPPEFVRERSLIIPIGDKKYITIPMPLGFHAIPNIGRLSTEFALGGFKKPADYTAKLFSVFAEAFNPIGNAGMSIQTLAPTAIDPLVALAENKDWTGKPIAKEDFSKLSPTPGFSRNKDTASDPSKWIAEAINTISGGNKYVPGVASPTADQIDYLFGQITGGVGREAGKAQQSIKAAATGEDLPPHKIPLVGRFYGNSENQSSQGNAFYSNLKHINEVEAELKGRHKDKLPLDEFKAKNPEYKLVNLANMVERSVSKQRKIKSDLIKHDAPREQVKAIDEKITKLMTGLNNRVKELKQGQQAAH